MASELWGGIMLVNYTLGIWEFVHFLDVEHFVNDLAAIYWRTVSILLFSIIEVASVPSSLR